MVKFQLPTSASQIAVPQAAQPKPFPSVGYPENPFPAAGVETDVLFTQHMPREIERINTWLGSVQEAANQPGATVEPLAIEGALGVGKTHLLRYLERHLEDAGVGQVLRKALTEHGMTRLLLSNLLVSGLPLPKQSGEAVATPIPLIEPLVAKLRADQDAVDVINGGVLRDSPIAPGLHALVDPADEQVRTEGQTWFARWLLRSPTTTSQRARLALKSTLDAEGETIRAISDVARLARHYGILGTWFVMLDQLEELWRPGVITFGRRARFLTDLRLLVDQQLEAAPLAILIAWNTRVPFFALAGGDDLRSHLQAEYGALWRRLGTPVAIPGLEERHLIPFAEEYLKDADKRAPQGADQVRGRFKERLISEGQKRLVPQVKASKEASLGQGRFAASFVLQMWRELALELATDFEK